MDGFADRTQAFLPFQSINANDCENGSRRARGLYGQLYWGPARVAHSTAQNFVAHRMWSNSFLQGNPPFPLVQTDRAKITIICKYV